MKRYVLPLLALGASFLTAGYVLGQNQGKSAAPAAAPAGQQQKLVKVATITGVQANKEFQANVQLVQAQRQLANELNAAMEKETDAKKKKELKTQLDTVLAKLNENNQGMMKNYGFTLARNYTMDIEVSHIYMLVSEAEAAEMERAQQKAQPEKAAKKK